MKRTCQYVILALWLVLGPLGVDGLRRHRHRRDEESELNAEQKENKHKPKFERCDDYHFSVLEESNAGTRVERVFAKDEDGPEGPNGQITYSIVSTHNKFVIDPKTGWLSTNAVFNRDEPDREKTVHVTVKATDNGRPQLEDVCTLKIKVTDQNDNSPVFDRAVYDVRLSQDTQVGTQIMRVSATDVDEGDNQKIVYSLNATRIPTDIEYFEYHWQTGVVKLKKKLDKPIGYVFELKAHAQDSGTPPKNTEIDVTLEVRESDNKPPEFYDGPGSEISLSEGYSEFRKEIATYRARSNIPTDNTVFFQLVSGRTEKTNKDGTFRAVQDNQDRNTVKIFLAKALEYEKVNSYTLTLQVRNSPDLVAEAQLTVNIEDENNQAPIFTNVESGNVLEHEQAGTPVMTVSAVDNDGTYPNNQVQYQISESNNPSIRDKFEINKQTGLITTKTEFDREEQAVYSVTIEAFDGAPSSLFPNGPNVTPQSFRIAIADKNDNPPYFPQKEYHAEVPEDQDVGSKVIEVLAKDKDTEASVTTYHINSGDPGRAFNIEKQTGFIRVAKPLDYESIKNYRLNVSANDGKFGSNTIVNIKIMNINDLKPKFQQEKYIIRDQLEETIPSYPIVKVKAIDPDLGDPSIDQNITYYLDEKSSKSQYFNVDSRTGEVTIVKKLDRDLPNGFPIWSTFIFAKDENGGPSGLESFVEFEVVLKDVNDNAPVLDMPNGLVWYENQNAGYVGSLDAKDYDTPENGPPFIFRIADNAPPAIKNQFSVEKVSGSYKLKALVEFDREKRKYHYIPITICDNDNLCGDSDLKLTIGDVNDNKMRPGQSEIFVYNYEGRAPDTDIGRVYVDDPDDWDLPDKTFRFKKPSEWRNQFSLDSNTGEIKMLSTIPLPNEINLFPIDFIVEDHTHGQVGINAVAATVNVTIKRIPQEAVIKSGSIRIKGQPEDFIRHDIQIGAGISKREKLKDSLSKLLNNGSIVEVFTVLPSGTSKSMPYTDVRFSAHGSPYFEPERLEGVFMKHLKSLEEDLQIEIVMVHIDECLIEGLNCPGQSCSNELDISEQPFKIYTNKTSFNGVSAAIKANCQCSVTSSKYYQHSSCHHNPCLNGGTCRNLPDGGYRCECPADNPDHFGSNCERLAASFNGQGWSVHKGIESCGNSHLNLWFKTSQEYGTLLYTGPYPNNINANVTDFLAVELVKGKLKMEINFGSHTEFIDLTQRVDDSEDHYLAIRWTNETIQMELDNQECANEISSGGDSRQKCFRQIMIHGTHHYINTNGPLHVGGVSFGADKFQELAKKLKLNRNALPVGKGFAGCIKNLTFNANGKQMLYDLGNPADGENYTPGCDDEFVQAVTATDLNMNFLIAILVCIAIILVVVVALTVYRRKRHVFGDKDIDCDIRENIINYEDEGGGEGDQTGYDLSVLRMMSDGTPALHAGHPGQDKMMKFSPYDAPDIQTFLQTNKDRIDHDPDATPYDDLRHYAYEGDGNSGGSLSSLNSGTSDGDLEFDYLHNFGPRFKKLADMYGEEPDSEDEPPPPPPPLPSESWC